MIKTRTGIFSLSSNGALKLESVHESQSEIDNALYDHPEKDLVLLPVITPAKKERPASMANPIDATAERVLELLEEKSKSKSDKK